MSPELTQFITNELSSLNKLIEKNNRFLAKIGSGEPDEFEISASGAMLQSFYGGIENIFKRIALQVDGQLEKTASWHKALLDGMAASNTKRPAVISETLRIRIHKYLDFRHVFRSAYSYDLNWNKMRELVYGCEETYHLLSDEIQHFDIN